MLTMRFSGSLSGSEGGWPEPSVTAREGKGCKGKCTEGKILTI